MICFQLKRYVILHFSKQKDRFVKSSNLASYLYLQLRNLEMVPQTTSLIQTRSKLCTHSLTADKSIDYSHEAIRCISKALQPPLNDFCIFFDHLSFVQVFKSLQFSNTRNVAHQRERKRQYLRWL